VRDRLPLTGQTACTAQPVCPDTNQIDDLARTLPRRVEATASLTRPWSIGDLERTISRGLPKRALPCGRCTAHHVSHRSGSYFQATFKWRTRLSHAESERTERLARVIASAEYAWGAEDQIVSRMYGDQWLIGKRSAVLLVPSVVTQGRERNVLINPEHPDFDQMTAAEPQDVHWDRRLFQR
jgi:hypothetical protein